MEWLLNFYKTVSQQDSSPIVPYHIIGKALEVIIGAFKHVCIYIKDHHIIQSHPSNFLHAVERRHGIIPSVKIHKDFCIDAKRSNN